MGWVRLLTSVTLIAVACVSLVHSKEKETERTYLVGIEDLNYLPFFATTSDLTGKGFLIELLDNFALHNGLRFEYIALPITRFHSWFERDNIDFRLPDNPNWNQQSEGLLYSNSLITLKTGTIVLDKRKHWALQEFNQIGTLFGFTPSKHWLARIDAGDVSIISDNSMLILVRMLYSESVQGLDLNMHAVTYYATKLGEDPKRLSFAEKAQSPSLAYTLSTKNHPEVLADLNQFLISESQVVASLRKKYRLD